MNADQLTIDHEGRRTVPYLDSEGILTWGIGRNLRDVPFSPDEMVLVNQLIDLMFENDRRAARADMANFPWFGQLNEARQAAVLDLRFNLGPTKFRGFRKFLAAMLRSDWAAARAELIDSRWHDQTGRRALRIERMIFTGQWPEGDAR